MDHSITSIFALSSGRAAAVFAVRNTLFDSQTGACDHTICLPLSVASQLAAGRELNDVGLLDLATIGDTWCPHATDPSELFNPADALRLLRTRVQRSKVSWLVEFDTALPILHSLYSQFQPGREDFPTCFPARDFENVVDSATRDCDHQALIAEFMQRKIPHVLQA